MTVVVRAVHTPEEIVFHLAWDDPTPSDPSQGAPKPDRIALQLPTGAGTGDRPYFLMGDSGHPVYLLTWTAGAGVGEATATGAAQVAPQTGEAVQARGQAVYDAGQYRVVIRRPRQTPDAGDFTFDYVAPRSFVQPDGKEVKCDSTCAVVVSNQAFADDVYVVVRP